MSDAKMDPTTNSAHLELPFGYPHETVHCPVCGTKLLYPEAENPCAHLAYVYLDEGPEFIMVAPHLLEATEQALDFDEESEDEDDDYDPLAKLKTLAPARSILHLAIDTGGMACGPVWSTLHIGFDFAPPEE